MKRFIPAWYSHDKWWQDRVLPYYSKRLITEFDDMISLMNMHINNDVEINLSVMNYFPDLRTFLHRHDLYEVTYWSLFDEIQGFNHKTPQAIDYRELQWPEDSEFMYTPYLIRCITSDHTYTNIYFNQDGYLVWLEDFENQIKKARYVFDDRGWLSSIITFDDNALAEKQYYMTIDGDCILTEDLIDNKVTVSKKYQHRFEQINYTNMELLIEEQFSKHSKAKFNKDDAVIVAADTRHNQLISKYIDHDKLCYSIFSNRNRDMSDEKLNSIQNGANWIVDSLDRESMLVDYKKRQNSGNKIMRITPFDAQILPNMSSQLYETYIGIWIDGMTEFELQRLLEPLKTYISANENCRLLFLTELESKHVSSWLKDEVKNVNDSYNALGQDIDGINALLEEETDYVKKMDIKYVPFEIDLIETISKLRIVVDLNSEPDLFLQICSISAGIPQINKRTTDYVKDGANGKVITTEEEIVGALDYYLSHLKHWNHSYAYAIKLVDEYASNNIINQLNGLIEGEIYGK